MADSLIFVVCYLLLSSACFATRLDKLTNPFEEAKSKTLSSDYVFFAATANATCNVRSFGAVGDGSHDDTSSIQDAFNACGSAGSGTVYFPTGMYVVSSTINVPETGAFQVVGDGWSSIILWSDDSDLFVWGWNQPIAFLTVQDLCVSSVGSSKSATSTAFKFPPGFVKSQFSHVLFYGSGVIPNTNIMTSYLGTCIDMGAVSDTSTVRDTVMWFLQGVGVVIGMGSEVRVLGGRIIGVAVRNDSSIGVRVTGNNGGVHIASTDIIALQTAVSLENTGAGSNREIFISHATLDSCWRGLSISDNSYVSIAGCWAASSDQDNIWVSPSSTGALLVIAGGTIFNGGAIGGDCSTGACNGITVNAGRFILNGVAIRNNKGYGIWVPNEQVSGYSITGNSIFENGIGISLSGSSYAVTGNVFISNAQTGSFGSESGGAVVANNVIH